MGLGEREALDAAVHLAEVHADDAGGLLHVRGVVGDDDAQLLVRGVEGGHHLGRRDQGLGRHAVGEDRSPAETVAVDDGHLRAELGAHQGRLVAAGAAADDHDPGHEKSASRWVAPRPPCRPGRGSGGSPRGSAVRTPLSRTRQGASPRGPPNGTAARSVRDGGPLRTGRQPAPCGSAARSPHATPTLPGPVRRSSSAGARTARALPRPGPSSQEPPLPRPPPVPSITCRSTPRTPATSTRG